LTGSHFSTVHKELQDLAKTWHMTAQPVLHWYAHGGDKRSQMCVIKGGTKVTMTSSLHENCCIWLLYLVHVTLFLLFAHLYLWVYLICI